MLPCDEVRAKGAPGPDDIPPTFLKALGPRARLGLLNIFNLSFSTGKSLQIWRIAIALPLKKAGKPPGCISAYRPVSLTSCVANVGENPPQQILLPGGNLGLAVH